MYVPFMSVQEPMVGLPKECKLEYKCNVAVTCYYCDTTKDLNKLSLHHTWPSID